MQVKKVNKTKDNNYNYYLKIHRMTHKYKKYKGK